MPHRNQRFEFNRSLTRLLSRHDVRLDHLSFSIAGSLVTFSGRIDGHESGDHDEAAIRALVRDIEAMPYRLVLRFHLDNWLVEKENGGWRIAPLDAGGQAGIPDDEESSPADGFIASAMLHARLDTATSLDDDS